MKHDNVDAPPQGEHSLPGKVEAVRPRNFKVKALKKPRVYGGAELERIDVTVRTLVSCCKDLARYLKAEGWIDVLEDLEPEERK